MRVRIEDSFVLIMVDKSSRTFVRVVGRNCTSAFYLRSFPNGCAMEFVEFPRS